MSDPLHLAVALGGAGWHPGARTDDLLDPDRWVGLAREAEAGLLDLVTLEDAFAPPAGGPGPLDAVLLAARLAPATTHLGLVPTVVATHTEPFHASTSLATLDHASRGRAGGQVQVASTEAELRLVGRRASLAGVHEEAADHVEVQRRLWDSWEDDAVIRDVATGRYVDRERLHRVDFAGQWFSVTGPSITPRPPQGQLPVLVTVTDAGSQRLAQAQADVAIVRTGAPRPVGPAVVLADVRVVVGATRSAAEARLRELDRRAGVRTGAADDLVVDTPAALAAWLREDRGVDGYRVRPAVLPDDLVALTREVVPLLQRDGAFRTTYAEHDLRQRLGLTRPANRYARTGAGA